MVRITVIGWRSCWLLNVAQYITLQNSQDKWEAGELFVICKQKHSPTTIFLKNSCLPPSRLYDYLEVQSTAFWPAETPEIYFAEGLSSWGTKQAPPNLLVCLLVAPSRHLATASRLLNNSSVSYSHRKWVVSCSTTINTYKSSKTQHI